MKVLQINATCGVGSTGKICAEISRLLTARGIENRVLYASGTSDLSTGIRYANDRYIKLQALRARLSGRYGFHAHLATRRLLAELERFAPDVVHLHNLHNHNCNIEALLAYLKKRQIRVIWTFHDCWAFTAYCPYFDMVACTQWKTACTRCPQRRRFSWFFDRSRELYRRKREAMTGLDLTVVTPSEWLAELVRQSFLQAYPVRVIHNGIDLAVFRPMQGHVRERYGIRKDCFLLLGVAFGWEARKGLDVFLSLARRLEPEHYQIVLVGTDDAVDAQLPDGVISIHRTQDQRELAELYSAADLLVDPTREENYPTVHMEAIACGTPVLTFRTGGCAEMLTEATGAVVERNDVDAMEREIRRICAERPFTKEACIESAKRFAGDLCFLKYVELYGEIDGEQKSI